MRVNRPAITRLGGKSQNRANKHGDGKKTQRGAASDHAKSPNLRSRTHALYCIRIEAEEIRFTIQGSGEMAAPGIPAELLSTLSER